MFDDILFVKYFYLDVINLLGLEALKRNNIFIILNNQKRKRYSGKATKDDIKYMTFLLCVGGNIKYTISFHPLNTQKESYNRLIIYDSIHFYLEELFHVLFIEIITIKYRANTNTECNIVQLDTLEMP